ncbi:MAG: zinc-dependent peptidase [Rhodocyclales bacterium]|nr:zinc-dependent peptidase [Rhodocyclales bacterium]
MIGGLKDWLRQKALDRIQVSDEQWAEAEARLPFLGHLDADERRRLREMARAFLADKEWSAAQDLVLTPEIQLSITLQACLPILNLGLEHYRGWVGVVVYPGDFVIQRSIMDEDGVVHEYDDPVLGEAWEGGPVLVAWFDDPEDADGVNVVIHEFAHKLDMENGAVDGMPRLPADMSRRAWAAAFEPAYEDFCARVDAGEDTFLDPYAADHPAEFFAVMSEAFFETPDVLYEEYAAVYEQLKRFYRQDPLQRPA